MNAAWFFLIVLIVPWFLLLAASRRDISRLRRLRATQARLASSATLTNRDSVGRKRATAHLIVH